MTVVVFVVTASVSVAGLLEGRVEHVLRRDGQAISSGQAWRLLTSLLVQDGGIPGTIFNLLGLLAVGAVAERVLGRRTWAGAYLGGGLTGEFVGWAGWQPIGAGNSVAVCGIAAALAVAIVVEVKANLLPAIVTVAWATVLLAGSLTIAVPIAATSLTRIAGTRAGTRGTRIAVGGFVLAATVLLLAKKDIHGAALAAGTAVGAIALRLNAP